MSKVRGHLHGNLMVGVLLYYDVNSNIDRFERSNVPASQSYAQWDDMVGDMTQNPTHGSFLAMGHLRTATNTPPVIPIHLTHIHSSGKLIMATGFLLITVE